MYCVMVETIYLTHDNWILLIRKLVIYLSINTWN